MRWQAESRSCKGQGRAPKPLQKSMLQGHPKYCPSTPTVKRTWKRCSKVQQRSLEQHSHNDLGLGGNLSEWKEGFYGLLRRKGSSASGRPLLARGLEKMPRQRSHPLMLPFHLHLLLTSVSDQPDRALSDSVLLFCVLVLQRGLFCFWFPGLTGHY